MHTNAVVILSDPESGTDEALGRLFNGLFLAYELKQRGERVRLIFQGAGSRWPGRLTSRDHPAHQLYARVQDAAVVCGGCADVFGAGDSAGLDLVHERDIPGTSGVVDLSRYAGDDARLFLF